MNCVGLVLWEILKIWCLFGFYMPASCCEFYFDSLDLNMTVRSDGAVGSRIHGIFIDGGESDYPGGLIMSPATQYFYLDERDIRVSTCLPAGLAETLEIRMVGIDSTSCAPGYLHIEVIPTIPALKTLKFADDGPGGLGGPLSAMSTGLPPFVIPQHYEIMVNNCSAEAIVDLFQVEFFNEGECVTFNCSVACINDDKIFWMAQDNDRPVKTNISGIMFNFIYKLNVTCRESGLSVDTIDFDASDTFEVTFIKACVTTENSTAQPRPTLASKSAPKYNSDTPITQGTTSLFTTETPSHSSSLMLHNQVMKSTFSFPKSALTDDANMSIITETTSSLPPESPQVVVSTDSSTTISIETEYLSININSSVDVSSVFVETSSVTLSTSALSGSALMKTSNLPDSFSKDSEKMGTVSIPVVSSMAGIALLSVIGVCVYALVSKRCRIMPLLQKKGKVEDEEDTKNDNSIDDPQHEYQTTGAISHA